MYDLNRVAEVGREPFPITEVPIVEKEVGIVYGAWGTPYSNDQIRSLLLPHVNFPEVQLDGMIEHTGFTVRHHDTIYKIQTTQQLIRTETEVGIHLLERALSLEHRLPSELARLYVSMSGPADPSIPYMIADGLGIEQQKVIIYGTACSGAVMALGDACDDLVEGYFGILAVEGVSKGVRLGRTPKEGFDPISAIVFGNGAAALVANRKHLLKKADGMKTEADVHGTLCAPNKYAEMLGIPNPPIGELIRTTQGVFLFMPESQIYPTKISMNPQTARYFPRLVSAAVKTSFGQYYARTDATRVVRATSHQPSEGVHDISGKYTNRQLVELGFPPFENPWVMDKIGVGNCVSAAFLMNMAYQYQHGLARLNEDMAWIGYGAGGSARALVGQIRA